MPRSRAQDKRRWLASAQKHILQAQRNVMLCLPLEIPHDEWDKKFLLLADCLDAMDSVIDVIAHVSGERIEWKEDKDGRE